MGTFFGLLVATGFMARNAWKGLAARKAGALTDNVIYARSMGRAYPVGLTELAIVPDSRGLDPLLPFLARLTRQRKWVILISPPFRPGPSELAQANIDPSRFMVVEAKSAEARAWALQQALRNCLGGAVLFWPSSVPDALFRQRIEAAAREGESSCISFDKKYNKLIEIEKAA